MVRENIGLVALTLVVTVAAFLWVWWEFGGFAVGQLAAGMLLVWGIGWAALAPKKSDLDQSDE